MSQKPASIRYTVSIPSVAKHIFQVDLEIDQPTESGQQLRLPAWIPGSYMIRDFAKNILWLTAESANGQSLAVHKLDKQTWQIAAHQGAIKVSYQIYALDLSVRSAFLDSEFGFANGTSLFLEVIEQADTVVDVALQMPTDMPLWQLATAMPTKPGAAESDFPYQCANYADLIEHPVLMGELDVIPFVSHGIEFEMIFVGGQNTDTDRMAIDLKKIADHHLALFGAPVGTPTPMKRYLFLTILTESDFGGLEHTASTALVYSRNDLPSVHDRGKTPAGYRTFLSLCSHELFHTWHVKRTKPALFIAPDLSQEVYTEQLWIYEGFTSYYDDFSLQRTQLISNEDYLEVLGQNLTRLVRNAGRLLQSVTESSWDAWTKFYKQDENAPNAIVSYYTKGGIIAMCLDLKLRLASKGQHSIDNIMQMLWQQFGSKGIGTDDKVIHHLLEQLGYDFNEFLDNALYSTKDLPVAELLKQVGVSLKTRARSNVKDQGGKKAQDAVRHAFGATYKKESSGITITQVLADSPAEQASFCKGDNLIALNGYQINEGNFQSELDKLETGSEVAIHYFRRGRLHETEMPVQEAPKDTVYLEIVDKEAAKLWLGAS